MDNTKEVLNVAAQLFNSPGAPRVMLGAVHTVPPTLPAPARSIVDHPAAWAEYEVTIPGHSSGTLSLLSA